MVRNRNPTIAENARRLFNTKQGDQLGDQIADIILPIVPIENYANVVRSASLVNGTSVTIFTTPSDKDFYLDSAQLSVVKDATSDSLLSTISVTVQGVARQILILRGLTLTAQSAQSAISFPKPILIDRGTAITATNNTATANISASGCITGHTVETISSVQ